MSHDKKLLAPDFQTKLQSESINTSFGKAQSLLENKRVLVACSGGIDSLALLLLCFLNEVNFSVCYIDHGLSQETKASIDLLKDICDELNCDFYFQQLEMSSNEKSSNVEANARTHRYIALEQARQTDNADVIATAHHSDDVAETLLINLMRGSGSGLASLAATRENIVRPLLSFRKSDLSRIVELSGLDHVEDPTNSELNFVRNRVRHELIPLLNDISNRDVAPLISRAAQHLREDNDFLEEMARSLWPKESADTKSLNALAPQLRRHALRAWVEGYPPSNDELERIFDVVDHKTKSVQISGARTIRRSGGVLYQDITIAQQQEEQ